jgi:septal ring factor EnvC (AmiA/AmiB activator)
VSFSTLFSIAKHFWPSVWFAAVFKEAEQVPAVVAGLFFTSGAVLVLSVVAILQYSHDAEANEKRLTSLQQTIARNTAELTCAKQDRGIAYLERQLSRLMQLAETADSAQELSTEITELKRKINNAQTKYLRS